MPKNVEINTQLHSVHKLSKVILKILQARMGTIKDRNGKDLAGRRD